MKHFLIAGLCLLAASPALSAEFVRVGGWDLIETRDPMTDKGRGIATTVGGPPFIVVKCDASGPDNRMYVQFSAGKFLGGGRNKSREIMYRFDNDPPVTGMWYHDGSVAISMNDSEMGRFVSRIATAEKLAVRASTYDYDTVDAVINVAGGREAIDRAFRACGFFPPWGNNR